MGDRTDALWPLAKLALESIHRPYPNLVHHTLESDEDARPPRVLTPAFYGCYDWHSAVHGHWLIVRALRRGSERGVEEEAARARTALGTSLTVEHLAAERAYLEAPGREGFERPYGLAWLLTLHAELVEWARDGDADAALWGDRLTSLVDVAAGRLSRWIEALPYPIRSGEHSQSAFSMGLFLDWADTLEREDVRELVVRKTRALHGEDRGWSFVFEPGGYDFLSPGLAVADLMRRVLEPTAFASWLHAFWPGLPELGLEPVRSVDPSDGKFAHLDGLNASRAWMLEGIAFGLRGVASEDALVQVLHACADRHRGTALEALASGHYAGDHWLGTFAAYLLTQRGIPAASS